MNTKSKSKLWLLDQSTPLVTSSDLINFAGAYPPSRRQVLLQFYGYHKYLQTSSNLQSFTMKAIKSVVKDLRKWWARTGKPTKSNQAIEKMIKSDVNIYKLRKKNRNRKTKTEVTKRDQFLENMKQTFRAIQPGFEARLQKWQQEEKHDKRHKEDYT